LQRLFRSLKAARELDVFNNVFSTGTKAALPETYMNTLQELFNSGKIKELLKIADTGDAQADAELLEAGLERARQIIAKWDELFYE
jgi:hypothetical protein